MRRAYETYLCCTCFVLGTLVSASGFAQPRRNRRLRRTPKRDIPEVLLSVLEGCERSVGVAANHLPDAPTVPQEPEVTDALRVRHRVAADQGKSRPQCTVPVKYRRNEPIAVLRDPDSNGQTYFGTLHGRSTSEGKYRQGRPDRSIGRKFSA